LKRKRGSAFGMRLGAPTNRPKNIVTLPAVYIRPNLTLHHKLDSRILWHNARAAIIIRPRNLASPHLNSSPDSKLFSIAQADTKSNPTALASAMFNSQLRLLNALRGNSKPIMTFLGLPSFRAAQMVAQTGLDVGIKYK
jgi:hypothetical protein